MVECLGQERETFQLLPCGWAAHSPLPPPPDNELTSLLPLAPSPGGGCQGHLSSPEWGRDRQAPEHRVSIVPPGAQASHCLEGAAGVLQAAPEAQCLSSGLDCHHCAATAALCL